MSNLTNIYPMAYVPNNDTICKLYYVGFPKAWKDKLIEVEKITKPRWDKTYALPTYVLKNSLDAVLLNLHHYGKSPMMKCGQFHVNGK